MIQSFSPKYDSKLHILNEAFQLIGVDFFKDIYGKYWEFEYERNIWKGIYADEEGEPLRIVLGANMRDTNQILQNAGWSLEQLQDTKILKPDACYIGKINSYYVQSIITEEFFGNFPDVYLLYLPVKKNLNVFCTDGQMLGETIIESNEYIEFFNRECIPNIRLYYIYSNSQTSVKSPLNPCSEWLEAMMPGSIYNVNGKIKGTGIEGMRLVLNNLELFACHGHEDWMRKWGDYFYRALNVISLQRDGNYRYVMDMNPSFLSDELLNYVFICTETWRKGFGDMSVGKNFIYMVQWLEKVIKAEEILFGHLNSYIKAVEKR